MIQLPGHTQKVIYTCIFGPYEDLKQPLVVTPDWKYICYTDQPLKSNIWRIVHTKVPNGIDPQRYARWFKIMHWIDWQYSIWIDASFQINCNLDSWWHMRFKSPFSCAKHPLRSSIYHEARSCIANNRADGPKVEAQWKRYMALSVPEYTGIITSGILLRENTSENIKLHEAWYKELSEQSVRDQLAFAFVSQGIDWINMYIWDYSSRQQRDFIYFKHYHQRH